MEQNNSEDFTFNPLQINRFRIKDGVYKCVYENNEYIIKEFHRDYKLLKEFSLTKIANKISPFTPKLRFIDKESKCLVIDFLKIPSSVSLKHEFDLYKIIKIMKNILSLLLVFHNYGFYHRDLKPDNIMVDNDLNVYFIDFGASFLDKEIYQGITKDKRVFNSRLSVYTPLYCPPEAFFCKSNHNENTVDWERYEVYTVAATICSISRKINKQKCQIISTITTKLKNNEILLIEEVSNSKNGIYDTNFGNKEFKKLLNSMLDPDHNNRPTVKECIDILDSMDPILQWII